MTPLTSFRSLESCFITATDTDAGKTYSACQILQSWKKSGLSAGAFKPVASGGIYVNNQLVSEDALALAQVTGQKVNDINPFIYEKPASPHIADEHHSFSLQQCIERLNKLRLHHNRVLVEGVGGWCVPLSDQYMLKDMVLAFKLPVVMVVDIKLGCINHALLTAQQIKRDGSQLIAWIANCKDDEFTQAQANIQTISQKLNEYGF